MSFCMNAEYHIPNYSYIARVNTLAIEGDDDGRIALSTARTTSFIMHRNVEKANKPAKSGFKCVAGGHCDGRKAQSPIAKRHIRARNG
jgi:hypothetical protein